MTVIVLNCGVTVGDIYERKLMVVFILNLDILLFLNFYSIIFYEVQCFVCIIVNLLTFAKLHNRLVIFNLVIVEPLCTILSSI